MTTDGSGDDAELRLASESGPFAGAQHFVLHRSGGAKSTLPPASTLRFDLESDRVALLTVH